MTVKSIYPMGHYSSPVVDPEQVRDYMSKVPVTEPSDINGIVIPLERMHQLWLSGLSEIKRAVFNKERAANRRFYLGGPFPFGDALFLRMMIGLFKPRRIVEIGSGFSTACMLDCADEYGLELKLTCVEPFPKRVLNLLRPDDHSRVTIHERKVQELDLGIVGALQSNDILFIDSTHVLKTGSDVHYELFHMLPAIRHGVIVHFHDCPYPFEYPPKWVLEDNFSWNEAYALRAFLMYNSRFLIEFWGSLFRRQFRDEISQEFPQLLNENPGASIWLRVNDGSGVIYHG